MTGKQTAVLTALLLGKTKSEAARAANVSESTLRRWMATDTAFQQAYRRGLDEMLQDATRTAQASITPAVELLREITDDSERDDRLRIQAADRILTHAVKLIEQYDIQQRLDALEKALADMGGGENL